MGNRSRKQAAAPKARKRAAGPQTRAVDAGQTVAIDALQFDPANARSHPERNLAMIQEALTTVGAGRSIVIDEAGTILAGEGAVRGAKAAGFSQVRIVDTDRHTLVAVRRTDLSADEKTRLALLDNRTAELAEWNPEVLEQLVADGVDLSDLWSANELHALVGGGASRKGRTDVDHVPTERKQCGVKVGDLFQLGSHRLLCGDSTDAAAVARLMSGAKAVLVHADPPYGMGKEAEGVLNDNQRGAALDEFMTAWWRACRPHVADNGSGYIWGSAEGLWRWWLRFLADSEPEINVRNEIVWDKGVASAGGVGLEGQEGLRQFPAATERALFIMLHQQSIGNLNADDFPESFEPLRAYLDAERARMGWGPQDTRRITGVGMHSHWYSRSQWALPSRANYLKLQAAAAGAAFQRSYDELRAEYEGTSRTGVDAVRAEFYAGRGYFDPTASPSSDIWRFPRVVGAERYEHATPKPVAMIERAVVSSARPGDLVLEPFAGTGTTLIACENTDRICYCAELSPRYAQTTIDRWEAFTGRKAERVAA